MAAIETGPRERFTNRLSLEKSPYLQQHQHNPVDWHPWGEEAIEKARREDKPIFLSIGYSTCHWCHVMERESFEDEALAAVLNRHFISIKLDREERPDLDRIYMTYVQARTGSGGWPLNVWLTPSLKPFYGGTYFPPKDKHGQPGFSLLLERIAQLWSEQRADIEHEAEAVCQQLTGIAAVEPDRAQALTPRMIQNAVGLFNRAYDPVHGGFGGAPKFPQPALPSLLLRYGVKSGSTDAVNMVLRTCERMAAGGIYDHLGGGFARYSVDAEWLVPHFEKMLYDNAQLLDLYVDAYLVSRNPRMAETARGICRYILRDMTHPEGGFYSAEDADSEGKEGKFYCWTRSELETLLTHDEFAVVTRYFGITDGGNFVDHSDPNPLPGQNVLHRACEDLTDHERRLMEVAEEKMLFARNQRVRPLRDEKILASWNGLMIAALCRAAWALEEPDCLAAAEKNAAFMRSSLWDATTRTLHHRWRDGERDHAQLLTAHAFLLHGMVALHETTLKADYLDFALAIADAMLARFYDPVEGGFFQSASTPDLILRIKDDYDGAEPSGNSVAALSLLRLAEITGRADLRDAAEKTIRLFAERMNRAPQAMPVMLAALDFLLEPPSRIVIAGDISDNSVRALLKVSHSVYQPNRVVLGTSGAVDDFTKSLHSHDNRATAYVCSGKSCLPPVHDPILLQTQLSSTIKAEFTGLER